MDHDGGGAISRAVAAPRVAAQHGAPELMRFLLRKGGGSEGGSTGDAHPSWRQQSEWKMVWNDVLSIPHSCML